MGSRFTERFTDDVLHTPGPDILADTDGKEPLRTVEPVRPTSPLLRNDASVVVRKCRSAKRLVLILWDNWHRAFQRVKKIKKRRMPVASRQNCDRHQRMWTANHGVATPKWFASNCAWGGLKGNCYYIMMPSNAVP